MTMDDIRTSDKDVLTALEVATVLGIRPDSLRITARQAPEKLGFNVATIGKRTLIPRLAFIAWMDGQNERITNETKH